MPVLTVDWLDRRATHKRLPDVTATDEYGDQDDAYATLESNVPMRIEQPGVEALDREPGDVIKWEGWLLASIANAPEIDDLFELSDRSLRVVKVEDLTDFDGNLDHYYVDLEEIERG